MHGCGEQREQPVETVDLQRAIFEATGRDMDRFFDEWVYGRGHAAIKVGFDYDDEKKLGKLTLEQTQDASASREAFELELDVAQCLLTRVSGSSESMPRSASEVTP